MNTPKPPSQETLREKVDRALPLLQRVAGNRRFMQLAGPVRQAINILKS